MTTYDNVVKAAERLLTDETKDTWGLADAVLAHVPSAGHGGDRKSEDADQTPEIRGLIRDLVDRLKDDDIVNPKGSFYTFSGLTGLREAAMAWPKADRYDEASFSTHQESTSKERRQVLAALVAVANGDKPNRPRGFDLQAWNAACDRIRKRTHGFPVSVDDVRIARKAKTTRPRHRKLTIDRINHLIVQHYDGKLDEEELYELLPKKIGKQTVEDYVWEYLDALDAEAKEREAREAALRQQTAAGEEGMTDEELAESDAALQGLQEAAENLDKTITQAEQEALGGPVVQKLNEAERVVLMALVFFRKFGTPGIDQDKARMKIAEIRRALDLIEMAVTGEDLNAEDAEFLNSLGISAA